MNLINWTYPNGKGTPIASATVNGDLYEVYQHGSFDYEGYKNKRFVAFGTTMSQVKNRLELKANGYE